MKMNEDNSTLDLFARPAPYQSHSAPSIAAAEAIEPTAGTLRAIVLQFIRTMGSPLSMTKRTERLSPNSLTRAGTRTRSPALARICEGWEFLHACETCMYWS